jgi:cytochrome c biogenesis protein CcdA/glutaredoxin
MESKSMSKLMNYRLLAFSFLFILSISFAHNICVYLFYGDGCPHCARVEPFIEQLEQKYPQLEVHRFEVYKNQSNAQLLMSFFDSYNVSTNQRGVPIIFISNSYIVGDKPILENLEAKIKELSDTGSECPSLQNTGVSGIGEEGTVSGLKLDIPSLFVTATGAALVDSINPCAIAVLLILLTTLLTAGEKTRALKAGIAFIISIYIVYFLFGVGLFHALQITGLSYWFYQILGLFAIVIGILNIKDYFWYGGGGFVMEIPRSWRPTLKKLLQGVTSPAGAFLIGFVVCLFELPCTGGPYLFMTGLLAQQVTQDIAIPILLYYNVLFVLPLVGIVVLLYFGMSKVEEMEEWRNKNIRLLHLIAGLIMVALGIAVMLRIV